MCLKSVAGTTALILPTHKNMQERVKWDLCENHQTMFDDGFVALVEARDTSTRDKYGKVAAKDAVRTGRVCHILGTVAVELFGMGFDPSLPLCFVVPGVIDNINKLVAENMARKPSSTAPTS